MNFFNQRIVTKSISLEEAVKKAKEPKKALRSLDEILADTSKIKTASAQAAEVKTAAKAEVAEAPKVEAKTEPKIEAKAEAKPEVQAEEKKAEAAVQVKIANEMPVPAAKEEAKEAPKAHAQPTTAAGTKTMKLSMTSSLDFRNWEAQAVVDAWKQHGSVEACVKNVGSNTSDPSTYCSLLKVAAGEAEKTVKTASVESKEAKAPVYKKFAKLTGNERTFLKEFFSKIYGVDYVDALLEDY